MTGRRGIKKARTRSALIVAAQRLFASQGYRQTTLDQIAEAADVHVQTLLRYFPSKERLALARELDSFEDFRVLIRTTDRPVIDVWRDFITQRWSADPERLRVTLGLLHEPNLEGLYLATVRSYEDELAAALLREAGGSAADYLHSRLVASMLVGGALAIAERWVTVGDDDVPDVSLLFDTVADIASNGFRATKTRRWVSSVMGRIMEQEG